jgi:hypothetical protein
MTDVRTPKRPFYYDPDHHTNDGKPWDEGEIEDLEHCFKNGGTIEDAARLLCRAGTVEEVRQKAKELGLAFKK